MKDRLLNAAFEAMENAYAPYSNYHVGCSMLTKDNRVISGVNVENASFGATNCAERSAIFACYSQGYRKDDILGVAVVSDGEKLVTPCGICRQVLSELIDKDIPIYLSNGREELTSSIQELLPLSFGKEDLDGKI